MFGFTNAAGHRENDRVVSVDLHKITVGQIKGAPSNERLIGEIFKGTKYKVTYEPNMGGLPAVPCRVCNSRGFRLL